MTYLINQNGKT